MAKSYWVKAGTKEHGPYSSVQIRQMAGEGRLAPDHRISSNRQKWMVAREVRGLQFPSTPSEESLQFDFEVDENSVCQLLDETLAPECDPLTCNVNDGQRDAVGEAIESHNTRDAEGDATDRNRQEDEIKRIRANQEGAVEPGRCSFCSMPRDVRSEEFVLYEYVYKDKWVGNAGEGIAAMKPKLISKFRLGICDSCLSRQRVKSADSENVTLMLASGRWCLFYSRYASSSVT